jgi:hypothetical protein
VQQRVLQHDCCVRDMSGPVTATVRILSFISPPGPHFEQSKLTQTPLVYRWSTWVLSCTSDYNGTFPVRIPSGTAVPAWAYLDVTLPDSFNVTAAEADAALDLPESSAPSVPSSTIASSSSSSTSSPSSAAASSTSAVPSSGSSSKKGSDTGALVGGLVGGIGGAAVLAAVATFFAVRRRRSTSHDPQAAASGDYFELGGAASGITGEKTPQGASAYSYASVPQVDDSTVATRMYDPGNRSTSPTHSRGVRETMEHVPSSQRYAPAALGSVSAAGGGPNVNSNRPGGYTGVAEV